MGPTRRLHCIGAHVAAVRRMVEANAPVSAVMLQISAVRGSLRSLARQVAETEIRARLEGTGVVEAARLAREFLGQLAGEPPRR